MPNPNNVAVVAEQFHGSLQQITLELIGAARFLSEKLGTGVSCFLLGNEISILEHLGTSPPIVLMGSTTCRGQLQRWLAWISNSRISAGCNEFDIGDYE